MAKRQAAVCDDGVQFEIKLPRTEPAPLQLLPPEIWEIIFRNLSAYWLRSARQTCLSWNRIIHGSPRLMDKFVLTLTKDDFVGDRQRVRNLLTAGGGFTAATFGFNRIGQYKPRINWLVPLGKTLHTLSLELTGTVVMLGQILKETPNLVRLHVDMDNQIDLDAVPQYRLEKLQQLSFSSASKKLVRFFRWTCPVLTELMVVSGRNHSHGNHFDEEIISLVFNVRKTIKVLKMFVSTSITNALISMEDLRLTGAVLEGRSENFLNLIQSQSNLESLDITGYITVQDFNDILIILPNLTKLRVKVRNNEIQPSLSVQSSMQLYKLKDLSLSRCNISRNALEGLQQTKITRLSLRACRFQRLSDLRLCKSLENIEASCNCIEDLTLPEPTEADHRSRVTTLMITGAYDEVVRACISCFPNLTRFLGGAGVDITEGFLQELSDRSPRLKELRVSSCVDFPPNALHDAANRFPGLESFYVKCMPERKNAIVESLRDVRGNLAMTVKAVAFEELDWNDC